MPGSITLPQVVLELEEEDRKRYEALKPPSSIVIRYGYMKMVAELPYEGDAKPGCGSKLVVRTRRGIEIGEMLTTTCGNSGCGKSVSRKQMLDYIDNSGGRDYPFTNQGKVLRVATPEDVADQSRLDGHKMPMVRFAKQLVAELNLSMKLVDVELLLGGERIIFHYTSENWIDFRELVRRLASEYQTRIEMHQVNARDEARITADYEKCGQHCCCKQFLKVLKPVSMRSAKVQKATLDPTKISGRCGRLMCCLRYEDETYETLRKKLPNRQSRVMTDDGPGTVIDTQILTQLVLVRLDNAPAPAAFPLENITLLKKGDPHFVPPAAPEPREGPEGRGRDDRRPPERQQSAPRPQGDPPQPERQQDERQPNQQPIDNHQPRRPQPGAPLREEEIEAREGSPLADDLADDDGGTGDSTESLTGDEQDTDFDGNNIAATEGAAPVPPPAPPGGGSPGIQPQQPGQGGGRRRRRRRRRGRGNRGGEQGGPGPGGSPSGSGPA